MLLDVCFTCVSLQFPFLFQFSGSECFTDEQRIRRRWCQSDRRCDAREQQRADAVPCAFVLLNAARRFFTCVSLKFPFCFSFLALNVSQNNNGIGDDGARAIADAMRVNSSVRELWLVRLCC